MRPARRARKEISYTYETCDDATDEDDIVPYNPKGYQPPEASMEQPVMLARIKEEQPSIPDSEAYQECRTVFACVQNFTDNPRQPTPPQTTATMTIPRKAS